MRLGRRLGRVLRIYDPTEMLLRRDEAVSSPLRFTAFHHDLVVWRGTVTVLAYPKAPPIDKAPGMAKPMHSDTG